jgi:hypothetical protein
MGERRRLSNRFDELVNKVRLNPGMDPYLRNLDYTALSSAALHGPVVILQPYWMCVITAPHADPQIIPLHDVSNQWIQRAATTFRLSARRSLDRLDDRGAMKRRPNGAATKNSDDYDILADIWYRIVQPLLKILRWEVSQTILSPNSVAHARNRSKTAESVHVYLSVQQECSHSCRFMRPDYMSRPAPKTLLASPTTALCPTLLPLALSSHLKRIRIISIVKNLDSCLPLYLIHSPRLPYLKHRGKRMQFQ